MAIRRSRAELKPWFENFKKPPQEHFWDVHESFFNWIDDLMPISKVENLQTILDTKASVTLVQNLIDYINGMKITGSWTGVDQVIALAQDRLIREIVLICTEDESVTISILDEADGVLDSYDIDVTAGKSFVQVVERFLFAGEKIKFSGSTDQPIDFIIYTVP